MTMGTHEGFALHVYNLATCVLLCNSQAGALGGGAVVHLLKWAGLARAYSSATAHAKPGRGDFDAHTNAHTAVPVHFASALNVPMARTGGWFWLGFSSDLGPAGS